MQITLDQETWDVKEDVPLSEVLADLGGKARARERIVASLIVGGRPVTDRDLHPSFLSQTIALAGPVRATTRSVAETLESAGESAHLFAGKLHEQGMRFLARFRVGDTDFSAFDQWLGGLADYVEYVEHVRAQQPGERAADPLTSCVADLLEARRHDDAIRLADILEYELLPRLKR